MELLGEIVMRRLLRMMQLMLVKRQGRRAVDLIQMLGILPCMISRE